MNTAKISIWVLRNCRFAQQQLMDFYDPTEYKPTTSLVETQDQEYHDFVKNEADPTKVNPLEALNEVLNYFQDYAKPFVESYQNIYQPETVSFPTGNTVDTVLLSNKPYVIDYSSGKLEDAEDWIHGLYHLDDFIPERDFNKEFWDSVGNGYKLYHATTDENLQSIKKRGLLAGDKTRGISNRGMGSAVFTHPEPSILDSYGDVTVEIDVGKMKASGYMPEVSAESPFNEEEQKRSIAHLLGVEDWMGGEYESEGLWEDTVAFYGNIPAKFLSIIPRD